MDLAIRLMLLGLLALALDLAVGITGLLSLGHAAFFGLAGYMLAWLTPPAAPANLWLVGPAALVATAAVAALFGWIAVRASGAAFLMITLALGQVAYYAVLEIPTLGGADGHPIPFAPTLPLFWNKHLDLSNRLSLYYVALVTLGISYLAFLRLRQSPFGRALQASRDNEPRLRALGVDTTSCKIMAFAVSGTVAGVAGLLATAHDGFVSPDHLAWHASGQALVTVIVGGAGTLFGPILGTFAYGILQEALQNLTDHWRLALGFIIIVAVALMPDGIASLFSGRPTALWTKAAEHECPEQKSMNPVESD